MFLKRVSLNYSRLHVTASSASLAKTRIPAFQRTTCTGPYALFKLDLKTKEVTQISPDLGFKIGHVQTSPTDPSKVSYCWQHIYVKGRRGMVGNTPTEYGGIISKEQMAGRLAFRNLGFTGRTNSGSRTGRASGYSARYLFGPNKGKQFIGIITPDGRENSMMDAPVSSSHNQIFSDNKHWVSDLYDGLNLVLFTIEGKEIVKKEVLYKHDSTMEGQPSHPHPHFSPDGRYILFATDKSGQPQVYTVKVNLKK